MNRIRFFVCVNAKPEPDDVGETLSSSWWRNDFRLLRRFRQAAVALSRAFLLRSHCLERRSVLLHLRATRQGRAEQRGRRKERKPLPSTTSLRNGFPLSSSRSTAPALLSLPLGPPPRLSCARRCRSAPRQRRRCFEQPGARPPRPPPGSPRPSTRRSSPMSSPAR